MDQTGEVTKLLIDWKNGSTSAEAVLTPIVYGELKRLAAHYLRDERSANMLQPTALVHEAYIKLVASQQPDWECRSHFFGVAAHLMRQILVDHARRHRSVKRGSGAIPVQLEEAFGLPSPIAGDVVALDDALVALAATDERKTRIIELRYFGGFDLEETAAALNISTATVSREQRLAEAWLYREMAGAC